MICETLVGKHKIPVTGNYASIVTFSSGVHGKKEASEFAFWTALLAKPVRRGKRIVRKIWGRARVGISAGDRFDRMKHEMYLAGNDKKTRLVYRRMWVDALKKGANIRCIRPSTKQEIQRWMKTHQKDACHAAPLARIRGKNVKYKRLYK